MTKTENLIKKICCIQCNDHNGSLSFLELTKIKTKLFANPCMFCLSFSSIKAAAARPLRTRKNCLINYFVMFDASRLFIIYFSLSISILKWCFSTSLLQITYTPMYKIVARSNHLTLVHSITLRAQTPKCGRAKNDLKWKCTCKSINHTTNGNNYIFFCQRNLLRL